MRLRVKSAMLIASSKKKKVGVRTVIKIASPSMQSTESVRSN